eukprot:3719338-Lingulodinium_polyedra.AAC.1
MRNGGRPLGCAGGCGGLRGALAAVAAGGRLGSSRGCRAARRRRTRRARALAAPRCIARMALGPSWAALLAAQQAAPPPVQRPLAMYVKCVYRFGKYMTRCMMCTGDMRE